MSYIICLVGFKSDKNCIVWGQNSKVFGHQVKSGMIGIGYQTSLVVTRLFPRVEMHLNFPIFFSTF